MKDNELFEEVLEKSLKKDENENETFDKILLNLEKNKNTSKIKTKSSKAIFYQRFAAIAVSVIFIVTAIIMLPKLLNNGDTPDNPDHYNSSDLQQVNVASDYDFSSIYTKSTEIDGFNKNKITLFQTKDEIHKIIFFQIYYISDDEISSITLLVFLVENFTYDKENEYNDLNKKFETTINNVKKEINYIESATPFDIDMPEIEVVKQKTKFKVGICTYYMQTDYLRLAAPGEEPVNMLKEIITTLF